jgi:hypothetical protein
MEEHIQGDNFTLMDAMRNDEMLIIDHPETPNAMSQFQKRYEPVFKNKKAMKSALDFAYTRL